MFLCCYTTYMLVVEVWHSFGTSWSPPGPHCLPPSLCYSGNGGDKAGQGRARTDKGGWLWNYELLNCCDVTATPAFPLIMDGKGWLVNWWSIFSLPTEIYFMSSILTSCLKYSTFTGTESLVFVPAYIQPGGSLVFQTCQFCNFVRNNFYFK